MNDEVRKVIVNKLEESYKDGYINGCNESNRMLAEIFEKIKKDTENNTLEIDQVIATIKAITDTHIELFKNSN